MNVPDLKVTFFNLLLSVHYGGKIHVSDTSFKQQERTKGTSG